MLWLLMMVSSISRRFEVPKHMDHKTHSAPNESEQNIEKGAYLHSVLVVQSERQSDEPAQSMLSNKTGTDY